MYKCKSDRETDVLRNEESTVAFCFGPIPCGISRRVTVQQCSYADVVYVESDRHQRPA